MSPLESTIVYGQEKLARGKLFTYIPRREGLKKGHILRAVFQACMQLVLGIILPFFKHFLFYDIPDIRNLPGTCHFKCNWKGVS